MPAILHQLGQQRSRPVPLNTQTFIGVFFEDREPLEKPLEDFFSKQERLKVNPELIHKNCMDDVLICAERGAIPEYLTTEDIKTIPTRKLIQLEAYYRPATEAEKKKIISQDTVLVYKDTFLSPLFPAGDDLAGIRTEAVATLEKHYQKEDGCRLKSQYIGDLDKALISQFFAPPNLRPISSGIHEHSVWQILGDVIPCADRTLFFNFFNNTKHYFFYKKCHEHVPGTMLIEACRQAMYVHFYRFSGYTLGDVTLAINTLQSDFSGYTEANYPVGISVYDVDLSTHDNKHTDKVVIFFQKGKIVATIRTKCTVIKTHVFSRMRNIGPLHSDDVFVPILKTMRVNFKSDNGTDSFKIIKMSNQYIWLSPKNQDVTIEDLCCDFCLDVGSLFSIHGRGYINRSQRELILCITEMDRESRQLYNKAIKDFSHVVCQN